MSLLLLFLGVSCGYLCFYLSSRLIEGYMKKHRIDNAWIVPFLLCLLLLVLVGMVVLVDNLLR